MGDVIGWDIGGAHLKVARLDGAGRAMNVLQIACPLWKGVDVLELSIDRALEVLGNVTQHAVTMTGELADIFSSRQEGVASITQAIQKKVLGATLSIFAGKRGFVPANMALGHVGEIASANWLASVQCAANKVADGIFVDIGSTTTDVVAIRDGQASPSGITDAERLVTDELVYSGVVRTPVMAVAQRLPFQGEFQRVMAEHFATMSDVYRLTGYLEEIHDMADTADGAGKNEIQTARRLARMVGRDVEDAPMEAWTNLANEIAGLQRQDIRSAIETVHAKAEVGAGSPLIGAGVGRFLLKPLADELGCPYIDFSSLVDGDEEARLWSAVCAPAYSVAWLRVRH